MAIEAKDILLGLRFKAYGSFTSVYVPESDVRKPVYRFEYLGGQFSVEVNEMEAASPPPVGTAYYVVGKVRYNSYNGSIGLVPAEKKLLSELSAEQFVEGLKIWGAGMVEDKKMTTMNRQTFLKAAIKWQGGLHVFNGLTPELYQRIPGRGQYVRFELGVTSHTERSQSGQQIQMMVPILVAVTPETLATPAPPKEPPIVTSPKVDSTFGTPPKKTA
jgi:hypothetical protein